MNNSVDGLYWTASDGGVCPGANPSTAHTSRATPIKRKDLIMVDDCFGGYVWFVLDDVLVVVILIGFVQHCWG